MTYSYLLHGVTIALPLPCPFLPRAESAAAPDVTMTCGPVPVNLEDAVATDDSGTGGYCWQASAGRYLLKGGMKSGRFLVEGGSRITFQPNERAEDGRVLFHLLHPVSAALFRQRGLLALHASTVDGPEGAIALCGASQVGKSTTLAALLQRGYAMISDDLTILYPAAHGGVDVSTGSGMMHMWDDAAYAIGLDMTGCSRHPLRRGKALLKVEPASSRQLPLRKLCLLETGAEDAVSIKRLTGAGKLNTLLECTYGPLFREEHPGLFRFFAAMVDRVEMFLIRRPGNRWSVAEVVSAVLDA